MMLKANSVKDGRYRLEVGYISTSGVDGLSYISAVFKPWHLFTLEV